MRKTPAHIAALAALAIYLSALLVPALSGRGCHCSGHGGVKCGHEGFVCHCCATPAYHCDEVSFSACEAGVNSEGRAQPPAIAGPVSHSDFAFRGEREIFPRGDRPLDGYRPQLLKPPSLKDA